MMRRKFDLDRELFKINQQLRTSFLCYFKNFFIKKIKEFSSIPMETHKKRLCLEIQLNFLNPSHTSTQKKALEGSTLLIKNANTKLWGASALEYNFIQSRDVLRESLMLREHTIDSFSGMKSAHCAKLICNYVEHYYLHIIHDSNKLVACFVARQ